MFCSLECCVTTNPLNILRFPDHSERAQESEEVAGQISLAILF